MDQASPAPIDVEKFRARRFAQAPATHGLPAFGRLCARFASALGVTALAVASPSQKFWVPHAHAVLDAMADAGAPLDPATQEVIVHDERPLFSKLDWALSGRLERASLPDFSGRLMSLFETPFGGPSQIKRSILALRFGAENQDWNDIVSAFGGVEWAGAFLIGHEASHGVEDASGWPAARHGARRCGGALGAEAAAWAGFLGVRFNKAAKLGPASALAFWLEEAVADATGVWAAALLGCPDPVAKCETYRRGASLGYRTLPLLKLLPQRLEALSFGELRGAIAEVFDRHGPQLAQAVALGYHEEIRRLRQRRAAAAQATPAHPPKPSPSSL